MFADIQAIKSVAPSLKKKEKDELAVAKDALVTELRGRNYQAEADFIWNAFREIKASK
jgi:hypothetical protein